MVKGMGKRGLLSLCPLFPTQQPSSTLLPRARAPPLPSSPPSSLFPHTRRQDRGEEGEANQAPPSIDWVGREAAAPSLPKARHRGRAKRGYLAPSSIRKGTSLTLCMKSTPDQCVCIAKMHTIAKKFRHNKMPTKLSICFS